MLCQRPGSGARPDCLQRRAIRPVTPGHDDTMLHQERSEPDEEDEDPWWI